MAHGLEAQACSAALGTRGRGGVGGAAAPAPPLSMSAPPQAPEAPGRGSGSAHCTKRPETWGPARLPGHQPKAIAGPRRTPLTVLARVAVGAGAVVLVGLGVDARAPVGAGVVAAAVVQVWGQGEGPQMPAQPSLPTFPRGHPPSGRPPAASYLCCRVDHPSWSHSCTARGPRSCRAHSQGTGHTHHRTGPANHSCTCRRPGSVRPAGGRATPGAGAAVRVARDAGAESRGPPQGWRPQPLKRSRPRARRG